MLGKHHSEEIRKKIAEANFRKVDQLDTEGNLVATYESMLEAAQTLDLNSTTGISRAIRFTHRTADGYRWRYSEKENKHGVA